MKQNVKFWLSIVMFQVAFGIAVFAITRQIYVAEKQVLSSEQQTSNEPTQEWSDQVLQMSPNILESLTSSQAISDDPVEISRLANEYFSNKQYARAAELYEQLLTFGPSNADVHNNLGITLHYLGRSSEALSRLDDGVAIEPTNQRIWLTLGFVNSELGNIDDARTALNTAVELGADTDVGKSALRFLDGLPQ